MEEEKKSSCRIKMVKGNSSTKGRRGKTIVKVSGGHEGIRSHIVRDIHFYEKGASDV